MTEYYFLASLLPPLEIGHVPTLGSTSLKELLQSNLTKEDLKKTQKLFRFIDMENMRAFWANEPFDRRGTVNREEMEHALANEEWPEGESFSPYLADYLATYHTIEERLKYFPLLMSQFFTVEAEKETGFLKKYFTFQREMRLVMVGFRAKKMKKDVGLELQYEDPSDPIVAQILAQKDAKEYEPPFEYKELKPIFEEFEDSPFELHKAIYAYEFDQIIDMSGGAEVFSVDRILNYIARLRLVERWLELDVHKGIKVVDTIEGDVK